MRSWLSEMKNPRFNLALIVSGVLVTVVLVIVFARYMFDVYIFGNVFLVIFLILLGSVQFAGIGLMIASRARTMESISGLMNLVMLPNWILAGIFFDSSNFPAMFQWIVQSLPLTPLVNALRSVMIEGAGIAEIWPELLVITAWTVISYLIAIRLFKWQ